MMARRNWPEKVIKLPEGAWRFDPFRRISVWVPADPTAPIDDAFEDNAPKTTKRANQPRKYNTGPINHGSRSGARTHRRRGEKVCDDCKRAHLDYMQERERERRAAGDPKFVCGCGGPKSYNSKRCVACAIRLRYGYKGEKSDAA